MENKSPDRCSTDVRMDTAPSGQVVSLAELAYCAGTTRTVVMEMLAEDLIVPCGNEQDPCFDAAIFERVCRIVRLHEHLGISLSSMGLILDLLDRLDALERQVNRLDHA